jgi:hypothetical protein
MPSLSRRAHPGVVAACAAGVLLIAFALTQKPPRLDDFLPFYRAAGLLGSPDIFAQTQYHAGILMFVRTPFYAALLHPLSRLDYAAARAIWTALMAVCFAGFVWLWPGARTRTALAACWSIPVLVALAMGQDIALMLLIAAAALRIWQSGRPLAAGLAASLLALKVTLLTPVALVFLARSRRGFAGIVAGAAVQFAACFVIQGPGWISQYVAAVRSPLLDQVPARMPCFAAFVTGPPLALLALAVYAGIWRIARRQSIATAITAALPLGIVAAPHCYAYDMAAAIPLLAASAGLRSPRAILAALALSPAPYLLLTGDRPGYAGAALLVGAVLLSATGSPRTPDSATARPDGTSCPNPQSSFPLATGIAPETPGCAPPNRNW